MWSYLSTRFRRLVEEQVQAFKEGAKIEPRGSNQGQRRGAGRGKGKGRGRARGQRMGVGKRRGGGGGGMGGRGAPDGIEKVKKSG